MFDSNLIQFHFVKNYLKQSINTQMYLPTIPKQQRADVQKSERYLLESQKLYSYYELHIFNLNNLCTYILRFEVYTQTCIISRVYDHCLISSSFQKPASLSFFFFFRWWWWWWWKMYIHLYVYTYECRKCDVIALRTL